jgi:hypothetical protein
MTQRFHLYSYVSGFSLITKDHSKLPKFFAWNVESDGLTNILRPFERIHSVNALYLPFSTAFSKSFTGIVGPDSPVSKPVSERLNKACKINSLDDASI